MWNNSLVHLGKLCFLHLRAAAGGLVGLSEPPLEDLLGCKERRDAPEKELDDGENNVSPGGTTHSSSAEEELAQEGRQGDEAREVEQHVHEFETHGGKGVVCSRGKSWGSLQITNGDNGEQRCKEEEVDLRRRRRQCVDIIPVGNICRKTQDNDREESLSRSKTEYDG